MTDPGGTFRAAALVSGLLTEEQVERALAAINAETSGPPAPLVDVAEEVLAEKLVELGFLNAWQVEQLRQGRTKFNLRDYQICDSLGQGGMGQVFKAEHPIMGRAVAIKVLPKSKSTSDAIKSFHHEIRALAHLDHPNLVRAYDAGQDGNVHFLVTEFVPGTDLRRLVRKQGALNQADAATIITQAAMGLQHAHDKGLIHRDVKPGNVMVTPDGKTKVLDLGLAGFLEEGVENEDPKKGRMVGTADYLAPEIILSPDNASAASDIYSLGCTLYYALTRKVPFPGGTTADKCHRHLHEVPLHPRRFNGELTDDFLEVLARMMDKDPANRIPTANEVVRSLAPWAHESIKANLPPEEAASAASVRAPKPPPITNAALPETQDFPEVHLSDLDSHEDHSQGTMGVSSQETSPALDQPQAPRKPPRPFQLPPRPGEPATIGRIIKQVLTEYSVSQILLMILMPIALILAAAAILVALFY